MAYSDPVQVITFWDPIQDTVLPISSASTAGVCRREGRLDNVATDGAAATDMICFPNGGSVEAFGVTIETALAFTGTKGVLRLQYVSTSGAAAAAAASISIPLAVDFTTGNTSTSYDGTLGIVGPNVRPGTATTTQAKASGARIVHPGFTTTTGPNTKVLPFTVAPGGRIYVELITTVTGTGSLIPFVIVRHNSSIFPATTASPVSLAPIAS